jgi:DNA-binding MarR family transcriptional regulator
MVALVSAARSTKVADLEPEQESKLGPEHLRLLRACRQSIAVADLASDLDLPVGVVRILVADLREQGLVSVHQPESSGFSDVAILKEVADALRRL